MILTPQNIICVNVMKCVAQVGRILIRAIIFQRVLRIQGDIHRVILRVAVADAMLLRVYMVLMIVRKFGRFAVSAITLLALLGMVVLLSKYTMRLVPLW